VASSTVLVRQVQEATLSMLHLAESVWPTATMATSQPRLQTTQHLSSMLLNPERTPTVHGPMPPQPWIWAARQALPLNGASKCSLSDPLVQSRMVRDQQRTTDISEVHFNSGRSSALLMTTGMTGCDGKGTGIFMLGVWRCGFCTSFRDKPEIPLRAKREWDTRFAMNTFKFSESSHVFLFH